jgi:hypothetical protein
MALERKEEPLELVSRREMTCIELCKGETEVGECITPTRLQGGKETLTLERQGSRAHEGW